MKLKTSEREVKELFIAWVLVSLAFAFAIDTGDRNLPESMVISLSTIGPAFIFHELAHKIVAQKFGCWAEFRMSIQMLLFAVIFAFFSGMVFAAPGAVMISGYGLTKSQNGKISVAGAATNLLMVVVFSFMALFGSGLLVNIGLFGAFINALIAGFNMIPFGPLDGKKVLAWNKTVYLTVVALSVFAIIATTGSV